MTQHFISVDDQDPKALLALIERANDFSNGLDTKALHPGRTVAQLFCENSTRTRVSFELAAKRLGMDVINLDVSTSSMTKGETLVDTARTLEAMGIDALVIRHSDPSVIAEVAQSMKRLSVVSAGAGLTEHPSQMLLDGLTILQRKSQFKGLTVAIIGDIYHSRVANSDIRGLFKLGVQEIRALGPKSWLPEPPPGLNLKTDTVIDGRLTGVDVIIALRVQQERIQADRTYDLPSYVDQFQLTQERLQQAKPDAIVLHPGPVNRGIELTDAVADGQQSVILQQVQNGVFARMAILDSLLSTRTPAVKPR